MPMNKRTISEGKSILSERKISSKELSFVETGAETGGDEIKALPKKLI
jgi:hypothetical protein